MMMRALVVLGVVVASGLGCGDDGASTPEVVACDPGTGGKPVGCVYGALVDDAGKPVVGAKVSACTDKECIITNTTDAGVYNIQGLTVEAHRIDVLGEPKGVVTMIWWMPVTEGVQSRLAHPVVVHDLDRVTKVPLAPAEGGTVLLADGQLELSAEPDTLKYPIGTVDKSIGAIEVDIDELPPFDLTPWKGKESRSRAFIFNPFPMKSTTSAHLRVFGEERAAVNATYTVYSANYTFGHLDEVGLMRADGSGALVSESGGALKDLTTIIIVPND